MDLTAVRLQHLGGKAALIIWHIVFRCSRQKAITLTAPRSKSFEGEFHAEDRFSTPRQKCEEFSLFLLKRVSFGSAYWCNISISAHCRWITHISAPQFAEFYPNLELDRWWDSVYLRLYDEQLYSLFCTGAGMNCVLWRNPKNRADVQR